MLEGIIVILGLALLLYIVLGGADFGAGILELFCPRSRIAAQRELTNHALGPVWEANHIWLILMIVVLFIAFPVPFSELSIVFHVPLTIMLFGIMFRGCAFTFRHYDPQPSDRTARIYSRLFAGSSVLSPVAQGLIAGGHIAGERPRADAGFLEAYVMPWCSAFSWSLALFVCALYCMTAAVFFVGEASNPEERAWCVRRARWAMAVCIATGGIVLLDPFGVARPIVAAFMQSTVSRFAIALATIDVILLAVFTASRFQLVARVLAGAVSAFILAGWAGIELEFLGNESHLGMVERLTSNTAPEQTLTLLFWVLVVAALLILPSLAYLFRVFKTNPEAV